MKATADNASFTNVLALVTAMIYNDNEAVLDLIPVPRSLDILARFVHDRPMSQQELRHICDDYTNAAPVRSQLIYDLSSFAAALLTCYATETGITVDALLTDIATGHALGELPV